MARYVPWLGIGFLLLVAWLLADKLREIDWGQVSDNLTKMPPTTLVFCLVMTGVSYLIFSLYDWLHLRRVQNMPPRRIILLLAFISYVTNFNFGSLVGAVGMRLTLYTAIGIRPALVMRTLLRSTFGHWLGYCIIAGAFLIFSPEAGERLPLLGTKGVRLLGLAMIVGGCAVLMFGSAHFLDRYRRIRLRQFQLTWDRDVDLGMRLIMALVNWSTICVVLVGIYSWHFTAPWQRVVGSYFIAVVASIIAHIPAGYGVFEYMFLLLLVPDITPEQAIGGMLFFRIIYFIVPLTGALPAYVWYRVHRG